MPVFVAQHLPDGLDDFVSGYLECAEFTFSDTDDNGQEIKRPIRGWSRAAIIKAKEDCKRFMTDNAALLAQYGEHYTGSHGYNSDQCAGHDFWYTRCGHGVGFSDRGEEPCFQALDDIASKWREVDVYRSDSAWLHLA